MWRWPWGVRRSPSSSAKGDRQAWLPFAAATSFSTGANSNPSSVAMADGDLDLAVANASPSDDVSILPGK